MLDISNSDEEAELWVALFHDPIIIPTLFQARGWRLMLHAGLA
jgi:hypothetical protein